MFPTPREREVMTGSSPDHSTSELLEMRAWTRAALVEALDASLDSSHPARYSRLNSTPILMVVGDDESLLRCGGRIRSTSYRELTEGRHGA